MANKLSSTVVPGNEVTAPEQVTQHARPDKTRNVKARGAKPSASSKSEPTERREKAANTARRSVGAAKSPTSMNTKADLILKKLRTTKGASMEVLIAETGWQAHSVRGFLSAVVKKKLALHLVSESGKDGVRRYRIAGDTKSA